MTWAALAGFLRSALAVVAVFVVSIVIHEFGHYWVAKRCGVAVPQFAIGFGPKLVRWMRRGTEFSIRLFPLGGLVQLAGEIPQDALFRVGEELAVKLDAAGRIAALGDPADLEDARVGVLRGLDLTDRMEMTLDFGQGPEVLRVVPGARLVTGRRNAIPLVGREEQMLGKPLRQRAAIILAGPVMNFLLAGVLFSALFMHMGVPVDAPVIGGVVPGSPAQHAGLMAGDRVVAVDGQPVSTWVEFSQAIQRDDTNPPRPLSLEINRRGQLQTVQVTPMMTPDHVPLVGVNRALSFNPLRAVGSGFATVYHGSVNALQLYGQVVSQHRFNDLAGPVGIADAIGQQAQSGFWNVVAIAGLLSLNLGLFNLLPIPALDGGRLLFMLVEMVRGRALDPRKEGLVHFVGFALLMLFAVIITYRDVTRLF
ncbi:RIP metalloprotease RseP [Alicyclobacillus sp.]|uniref:RIP metalloprotease RseP n=1 Tax=Alicyclobacillus sp. TaxID=61169 RepID=UPI0025C27848|nr:RIP metalloprotease RseP [Alicyclobacillus sp.]